MGVRDVRLPLHDLLDPVRHARIGLLKHLGFRITLFGYSIPENHLDLVASVADNLTDWEITLNWRDVEGSVDALSKAYEKTGLPIYISRMRTKEDIKAEGTYFHVINHGFDTQDRHLIEILESLPKSCGLTGAVFRLGNNELVADRLEAADRLVTPHGLKASVHLRVAGDNPAISHKDDDATNARVLEAMETRARLNNTRVFCDTLADVDRGYFVRNGAIDRYNNPRPLLETVRARHVGKN